MIEKSTQYPIGQFHSQPFSLSLKEELLIELKHFPEDLANAVKLLSAQEIDTPYRVGGWSPKQIVHHMADSSLNYYLRCKCALAQEGDVITLFDQDEWIKLSDSEMPIDVSIALLYPLHQKWVKLLKNIPNEDWMKTVIYPNREKPVTLWNILAVSAWHGKHHTQQILNYKK